MNMRNLIILFLTIISSNLFAQKINAIKTDIISPINNTISFTYERCLQPYRSVEFTLGTIGVGLAERKDNPSGGILFRGGYKLMKDIYMEDMKNSHGSGYLKFELDYASYNIFGKTNDCPVRYKYRMNKWAIMSVFGYQHVINDLIIVDLYSGIGLGNKNLPNELKGIYPYGFATLGSKFPLAFSLGLRCGVVF